MSCRSVFSFAIYAILALLAIYTASAAPSLYSPDGLKPITTQESGFCDVPNPCFGAGTCNETLGVCHCLAGVYGERCEGLCDKTCGACDGPTANDCTVCHAGRYFYQNNTCVEDLCLLGNPCLSRGSCANMTCSCDTGYHGPQCQFTCDPSCDGCNSAGPFNCSMCADGSEPVPGEPCPGAILPNVSSSSTGMFDGSSGDYVTSTGLTGADDEEEKTCQAGLFGPKCDKQCDASCHSCFRTATNCSACTAPATRVQLSQYDFTCISCQPACGSKGVCSLSPSSAYSAPQPVCVCSPGFFGSHCELAVDDVVAITSKLLLPRSQDGKKSGKQGSVDWDKAVVVGDKMILEISMKTLAAALQVEEVGLAQVTLVSSDSSAPTLLIDLSSGAASPLGQRAGLNIDVATSVDPATNVTTYRLVVDMSLHSSLLPTPSSGSFSDTEMDVGVLLRYSFAFADSNDTTTLADPEPTVLSTVLSVRNSMQLFASEADLDGQTGTEPIPPPASPSSSSSGLSGGGLIAVIVVSAVVGAFLLICLGVCCVRRMKQNNEAQPGVEMNGAAAKNKSTPQIRQTPRVDSNLSTPRQRAPWSNSNAAQAAMKA